MKLSGYNVLLPSDVSYKNPDIGQNGVDAKQATWPQTDYLLCDPTFALHTNPLARRIHSYSIVVMGLS
jgi:hypothetical protein